MKNARLVGSNQYGLWDLIKKMLSTEDSNIKLTEVTKMPLRNTRHNLMQGTNVARAIHIFQLEFCDPTGIFMHPSPMALLFITSREDIQLFSNLCSS